MADYRSTATIFAAEFQEIVVASYGNTFANGSGVYEAQTFLRSDGKIEIKPQDFEDSALRSIGNRLYDVTGEFTAHCNRNEDIHNAYLLCNVSGGTSSGVQARILLSSGKYLNFVKAAGTATVPTSVGLLGLSFEFKDSVKESNIKYTFKATITEAEYNKLMDATYMATPQAGDTGGPVLGLVAGGYSRANNQAPGVYSITIAGNTFAIADDTYDISIKSLPTSQETNKIVPVNRKTMVDLKFGTEQTDGASILRAIVSAGTDETILVTRMNGETLTFNAGALGVVPTYTTGDKENRQMYEAKGGFINNPDEASPTSIDFTSLATNIDFFLIGFVAA